MSKIPSLQDLLEAGVHFGHKVSRGNPRMSPFIYGAREGVHIIDLTLSEKYLKEAKEKGTLKKYTKKEQLLLDRRAADLEKVLGGVANLTKVPEAIFVLDANKDSGAVKEANRIGVKVIAVTDTNSDPTLVDYPIPANDDAIKSIKIMLETIADAYADGQAEGVKNEELRVKKEEAAAVKAKEEELPEEVIEEVAAAEEKVEKESLEEP